MTATNNIATAAPAPSLIMALHGRWTACQSEYEKIDAAQGSEPGINVRDEDSVKQSLHFARSDAAMSASSREAMHLRTALLYQVPIDNKELAILTFHLWCEMDDLVPELAKDKDSIDAISEAINSVFDYMISEGFIEMDRHGSGLQEGGMLAFYRRRYRTGLVDDDD